MTIKNTNNSTGNNNYTELPKLSELTIALQGGFIEHYNILKTIQTKTYKLIVKLVKTEQEVEYLDALIIPGGESTVLTRLIESNSKLLFTLKHFVSNSKKPVWGTCAGLIVLSNKITNWLKKSSTTDIENYKTNEDNNQNLQGKGIIGGLDIVVERNGFGSQYHSFEKFINCTKLDQNNNPFLGVFIRAPIIKDLSNNQQIEKLAQIEHKLNHDDKTQTLTVAVQQHNILGTCFHPELTNDTRWHKYFVDFAWSFKRQTV